MVLQIDNANKSTEGENVLPNKGRPFVSNHFRSAFHAISSRRRVRNRELKPIRYAVEQAKRRRITDLRKQVIRIPAIQPPLQLPTCVPGDAKEKGSSLLFHPFDNFVDYPLSLPRPEYMEVPKEAIEAIDPSLAKVDVSYIRDTLMDNTLGPSMYQATNNYTLKAESDNLETMRIIIKDTSSVGPTHLLIVYGPQNPLLPYPRGHITIDSYPVHSLVFAAHCAKIPTFPPQIDPPQGCSTREFILPTVKILLKYPKMFPFLMEYLYLKRTDLLFCRLLGLRNSPVLNIHRLDQQERLAATLENILPTPNLIGHMWSVRGFKENACSLGVYDDGLWAVIDAAYRIILMTLAIRHGTRDTLESIKAGAVALDRELESTEDSEESGPESAHASDSVN